MRIRRGYVYTADLNPRRGTESGKIRPVLVLQTDLMNGEHPSTVIFPLTTRVRPDVYLLRVHLAEGEGGIRDPSDIMIDQIKSIDNRRFRQALGKVSSIRMQEVEEKISVVLDLSPSPPGVG